MQHVSTYNSHPQAKLRTVNILQGGCAYLGSHMAYSTYVLNPTYNSIVDISYFMYGEKPQQKHCKPYGIPNAHNHPVKH